MSYLYFFTHLDVGRVVEILTLRRGILKLITSPTRGEARQERWWRLAATELVFLAHRNAECARSDFQALQRVHLCLDPLPLSRENNAELYHIHP